MYERRSADEFARWLQMKVTGLAETGVGGWDKPFGY